MRSSASWAVFDEVPVANSPRTKKADNANLGLATAAHVEILATVGGRRVNDNATQVEVRPAFVPSRAWHVGNIFDAAEACQSCVRKRRG